jgi:hypothetical protein
MTVQLPVWVHVARSEGWMPTVNRIAVMRIQASYTVRRYAFSSVVSLHFASSIVDQLATVVVGYVYIHVGDMPIPWGRPQITPLPGNSSVVCVKTYRTASTPQRVGCTPGTVCFALTSPRVAARFV